MARTDSKYPIGRTVDDEYQVRAVARAIRLGFRPTVGQVIECTIDVSTEGGSLDEPSSIQDRFIVKKWHLDAARIEIRRALLIRSRN